MVDSWKKDVMQTKQIDNTRRFQDTIFFHLVEQGVEKMVNSNEDISPKTLNSLIVYRQPNNYAPPIQPPVPQHSSCYLYVFTPFV